MKNILSVVCVIMGTLIGAGFASGQEINIFFFQFGESGIIGLIISCILIGLTIYSVLNLIYEKKINTYKDFLKLKIDKGSNLKIIANSIVNFFLLITFFVMISGFGTYFYQEMKINNFFGSILLAIICFFIFLGNINCFIKINQIIVPILVIFIGIIGIKNMENINYYINLKDYQINYQCIVKSIMYYSYNTILLIPVLITIKNKVINKKNIVIISILSGLLIFFLGILIYFLIYKIGYDVKKIEMPVVFSINQYFYDYRKIYGIVILLSIFTTSISSGISFLNNVVKNRKYYPQVASIMCIISIIMCNLSFSKLINSFYQLFGILGLIQIFYIILLKKK